MDSVSEFNYNSNLNLNIDSPEISTLRSSRVSQMQLVQNEGLELFKKKNQDYGDAFAKYGVLGVLVRMGDKIARLQSISTKSVSLVNSESLRDTLIDLHNYSAMAIMLLDEDENKEKIATKNNYPNPPPPTPRHVTRPKW
jgi:hypothetical protein